MINVVQFWFNLYQELASSELLKYILGIQTSAVLITVQTIDEHLQKYLNIKENWKGVFSLVIIYFKFLHVKNVKIQIKALL